VCDEIGVFFVGDMSVPWVSINGAVFIQSGSLSSEFH
jgi:hypothetical protein